MATSNFYTMRGVQLLAPNDFIYWEVPNTPDTSGTFAPEPVDPATIVVVKSALDSPWQVDGANAATAGNIVVGSDVLPATDTLTVAGTLKLAGLLTDGVEFADGTVQTTAGGGGGGGILTVTDTGIGVGAKRRINGTDLELRTFTGTGAAYTDVSGGFSANGSITFVDGSLIQDGETFTLSQYTVGVLSQTYEFDKNGSVAPGNIAFPITDLMSAVDVCTVFNGLGFGILWDINHYQDPMDMTRQIFYTVTSSFDSNIPITTTVADPGFIVTGFSGGQDPTTVVVDVTLPPQIDPATIPIVWKLWDFEGWLNSNLNESPWVNPGDPQQPGTANLGLNGWGISTGGLLVGNTCLYSGFYPGAYAIGWVQLAAGATLPIDQKLTISVDGVNFYTFEFDKEGSVDPGSIPVPITDLMTASEVGDALYATILATPALAIDMDLPLAPDNSYIAFQSRHQDPACNNWITSNYGATYISFAGMNGADFGGVSAIQFLARTTTWTRLRFVFQGFEASTKYRDKQGKLLLKVYTWDYNQLGTGEFDQSFTSPGSLKPLVFEIETPPTLFWTNTRYTSPPVPPGYHCYSFEWTTNDDVVFVDNVEIIPTTTETGFYDDFYGTTSKPFNENLWSQFTATGGLVERYAGGDGLTPNGILPCGVVRMTPGTAGNVLVSETPVPFNSGLEFEAKIALRPEDYGRVVLRVGLCSDPVGTAGSVIPPGNGEVLFSYDPGSADWTFYADVLGQSLFINPGSDALGLLNGVRTVDELFVTVRFEVHGDTLFYFWNGVKIGEMIFDAETYWAPVLFPFIRVDSDDSSGNGYVYVDYIQVSFSPRRSLPAVIGT